MHTFVQTSYLDVISMKIGEAATNQSMYSVSALNSSELIFLRLFLFFFFVLVLVISEVPTASPRVFELMSYLFIYCLFQKIAVQSYVGGLFHQKHLSVVKVHR